MSKTNSEEPKFPKVLFAGPNFAPGAIALTVYRSEGDCMAGDGPTWVAMYELKSVRRLRKEVREV